jgi:hypothetical protein
MRRIPPNERTTPPGDKPYNFNWWCSAPENQSADMMATARQIASRQAYLAESFLYWARMHGGTAIAGLSPFAHSKPAITVQVAGNESVGLNIIENCCSAAQAEICQNKPKATFTTNGADWDKREAAEKLDKFCEGQFYKTGFYDLAPEIFLDAEWAGTGILKVYQSNDEVALDRVFPWELLVDQADGMYGKPQCFYQTKWIDRSVLLAEYGADNEELRLRLETCTSSGLANGRDPFMYDTTADLLQVVEAWHLPSGPKAKDGRHIIAVGDDDIELLNEECEDHPFVFLRWMKRPFGFWGKGLTEQLAGVQKEINRLLLKIQRAFAKLGITRVFIERGSKVNPAHMRANDGDIIEYTGTPPSTVAETPVSPQIFEHLWQLERKAYEITGISQMTAQGQTLPGDVSGKALRMILQNHSKRLRIAADMYEQFFLDAAAKMIETARGIKGYKVRFNAEGGYEELDFDDIDLKKDEYDIRAYPTNALPSNPAEKLAVVQEWVNIGWVTKDEGMMLAEFPDTKEFAEMNPVIASKKAIMRRLTDIVKRGTPWVPDPYVDMQQVKPLAVALLLNAERNHCPEDRLDMLREMLEIVVEGEMAMQPPPQAGPPMGPDGMPMQGPADMPMDPNAQPGAPPPMAPPGVPM